MLRGVTIDGPNTRDMDDGLFAEMSGGNVRLSVAITNVAAVVTPGGMDDGGARSRCFTKYYNSGTTQRTMLSTQLSETTCSLAPNVERPVMVVEVLVGPKGELLSKTIRVDQFMSTAKLAYDEVPKLLDGTHPWRSLLAEPVRAIHAATTRLFAARKARGSVAFADPNMGCMSSEEGALEMVSEQEFVGCMMVQEAMIMANIVIARYAATNDVPIIYRNHVVRIAVPPRADVMAQLEQVPSLPTPHLCALIERVDVLLGRAMYSGDVRGHYALCAPFYTHTTSPMRRYADLVTQRQILAHLQKEPFPHSQAEVVDLAAHINNVMAADDIAQREWARGKALARAQARAARGGYQSLVESDFERAMEHFCSNGLTPSAEFVDVLVRRINERTITHRAMAMILPALPTAAVWEHVVTAACDWFGASPEDAMSVLKVSKDLNLWAANVGAVETKPGPRVSSAMMVSCAATLIDGPDVVHGPKCSALAQQKAWQRAVAAVVIQRLDGQVPTEWLADPSSKAIAPTLSKNQNPIGALSELAQRFSSRPPTFQFEETGPAHKPTFKCVCKMGMVEAVGMGEDKRSAKTLAARNMLTRLNWNAGGEAART